MFSKKCPRCDNKTKDNHDFCPFCGYNLNSEYDKEDYGFLGKNDFIEDNYNVLGFGDTFIEKLFNSTMKILEKQMRNISKEVQEPSSNTAPNNLNFQFFVNGKRVFPEKVQQKSLPSPVYRTEKINQASPEKLKKFAGSAKLPKKEPNTKLKRLGNKIVYELEVPGVNNIDDILINRLENSIEIKALSKNNVYHKTLNLNLPVVRYQLINGNLFVELGNNNQTKPL